jgi:hypothetical protein
MLVKFILSSNFFDLRILSFFSYKGAKIFYEETNKKLSEQEPLFTDEKDHYKRYKKMQDAWVREDVQNGHHKVASKHFHLSLRTKLKI